jgi:hypothetical protein
MALWQAAHAEFSFDDIGSVELLAQACASLDRAEALAECIARDGEVIYVRNVPKPHPAIKDELALRAFVSRSLQRLGLTGVQVRPVGRPPSGGIGITFDKLTRGSE